MARRVCPPDYQGASRLDRLASPHARSLVLALGLGPWDLTKRAREELKAVAYLVRYSNGGVDWETAMDLPLTDLHRRGQALVHWIKIENAPPKK